MRTYALHVGDVLVVSVDDGAWQEIEFAAKGFRDIAAATADELATVLSKVEGLTAEVDADGQLVLRTGARGGHASIEVDLARSTAAAPLGLAGGEGRAVGGGLRAARVHSPNVQPFPLRRGSEMTLVLDGRRRRISFDKEITDRAATAAQVAEAINARRRGVAQPTRDGAVLLTSPTVGPNSRVEVLPADETQGKVDAARVLGFVGAAASSHPHTATPARLVCSGAPIGLQLVNLTANPIELHFATGSAVLPAGGALPVGPLQAAHGPLQRLLDRGAVRLTAISHPAERRGNAS
jgi:hypothetical protein